MSDLKIARIDVFQVDLPYSRGVYHLSGGRAVTRFDGTFVRITTNNGIEGWGESTPFDNYIASHARGVRAGIEEIAPRLIGLDPRRVDRINDAMDAALFGHEDAKTAIDVACWDVFGKAVGLPVCELLGGRTDVKLPIIASIPVADPEGTRKHVAESRAAGFTGFSVKIGGDPVANAARITAALESKEPHEFFLIDANGGLTVEAGLRMLRLLPDGLDFVLEAPCATYRESMSLRRRTNIPIIFDELVSNESTVAQLVADDAVDGVGLKISKAGGLTRGRRVRDICLAAGYTISVQDCSGSDIAFAAIVHLGQTIPARNLRCVLECREMVTCKTADGAFDVHQGLLTAPTAPGLGVTPRLDVMGEPVASYS
ncbi:enolase C-terminal domain-like protein [Thelonectria olida]|uniref:Enolase C-terminal domain-like protein n=1 Tax=Thelonectria olida TaxID=1576542 RepID=A0A9P8W6B1_9HYPO|nr:enolase C-terminal domain-like protein [Thelonectria olida]